MEKLNHYISDFNWEVIILDSNLGKTCPVLQKQNYSPAMLQQPPRSSKPRTKEKHCLLLRIADFTSKV